MKSIVFLAFTLLIFHFNGFGQEVVDYSYYIKSCNQLVRNQEYSKATEECSKALEYKKTDVAYFLLAYAYSKLPDGSSGLTPTGEVRKISKNESKSFAVYDGEKCTELAPNEYPCFSLIGLILYNSSNRSELEKAVKNLSEGIRLGDKNTENYAYRATANFKIAETLKPTDKLAISLSEAAISDYSFLLQNNPKAVINYLHRSEIYEFLQKYELAIADLTKFLEKETDDDSVYLIRGNLYYKIKKYQLAIDDFTTAFQLTFEDEIGPHEIKILSLRALAYKALKKKKEFCEDLKTIDREIDCEKEWKKK